MLVFETCTFAGDGPAGDAVGRREGGKQGMVGRYVAEMSWDKMRVLFNDVTSG